MTLDAFMALVPWDRRHVTDRGMIRTRGALQCPICAVYGGRNMDAVAIGAQHYLSPSVIRLIITAADGMPWTGLRREMERRMESAPLFSVRADGGTP